MELSKIKKYILNTLFPIRCIACNEGDEWVCQKCLCSISTDIEQSCPICDKVTTPDGKTCFDCKRTYSIDGILAASRYRTKNKKTLLAKLVHYYKYRFIADLSFPLGEILKKALLQSSLPLPDFIVPVPLHSRRIRWRGFNQAKLLSDYLAQNITPGLEIAVLEDALVRNKYTTPQMHIKNIQRRKSNIKGSFSLNKKYAKIIRGKNILLVDDIATTGSTLFECAKVLKKKKSKKVYGVVLAKQ